MAGISLVLSTRLLLGVQTREAGEPTPGGGAFPGDSAAEGTRASPSSTSSARHKVPDEALSSFLLPDVFSEQLDAPRPVGARTMPFPLASCAFSGRFLLTSCLPSGRPLSPPPWQQPPGEQSAEKQAAGKSRVLLLVLALPSNAAIGNASTSVGDKHWWGIFR